MSKTNLLRYIGNFLLIIGYFVLLWGDFKYGLLIKCIGGLLTLPFAIKLKLWDVLILCVFYGVIEFAKLSQLFLVS
jgi:hypothetical protein